MKIIPGWFYIIIGAIVSLLSYLISYEKMLLFFYAGIIFIGVGVTKIGLGKILPEVSRKTAYQQPINLTPQQIQQRSQLHRMEAMQKAQTPLTPHAPSSTTNLACANCRARLHPSFSYCPRCGQKLAVRKEVGCKKVKKALCSIIVRLLCARVDDRGSGARKYKKRFCLKLRQYYS
ncbi:hypothetical protein HY772_00775 [Candidatus Woesearchaeota archaeon]|nr:hypothetical protein [Candidatus Woesearchaeota archaeon]